MPMVNRRLSPSLSVTTRNSSASFPTPPSVMKITWRMRPASFFPSRAFPRAGSISVPPSALRCAVYARARRTVDGSAALGAANSDQVTLLNWMMLNRSRGLRRFIAMPSASLACFIEVPAMDPEVSMMKITSRGRAWSRGAPSVSGGVTIIRR